MTLVGVDLHSREQSVAMLDTTTGELEKRRIRHDGDDVERSGARRIVASGPSLTWPS